MREIESTLERHLQRQLLKFAAGQHICCPFCGNILDWTRTVNYELSKDGQAVLNKTFCSPCWDKCRNTVAAKVTALRAQGQHEYKEDILDGRQLK